MTVYSDYTSARIGILFGLSAKQLLAIVGAGAPALLAFSLQKWLLVLPAIGLWALLTVLIAVPIRGRSATSWLSASLSHVAARISGRSRFRSRAALGQATDLADPDLPGTLTGIEILDGPPAGPHQRRVAIIQNHACRTWALTAAVTHPGVGMADAGERLRLGRGFSELLELCSRTELIDELLIVVRTVPDDGAERAQWLRKARRTDAPQLARQINDDLQATLSSISVRTETFVTFVVPDGRLRKAAKDSGGTQQGRANVLYLLAGEVESMLTGAVGMSAVSWLTSAELAAVVRTGFAPGDRAGLVDAAAAAENDPTVAADVPWGVAGAAGAEQAVRHYTHDAWNSSALTIKLPVKGAVIGALAPILTPTQAGERRSCLVAFPIMTRAKADNQTRSSETTADMAEAIRERSKVRQRSKERTETERTRRLDEKVAAGNALVEPYAVATVTVPNSLPIAEFSRRLDSATRTAGFTPQRLDLSHDVGFAASTLPLGVSLARGNG